jgi:beta-lactamase class A
VRTQALSLTAAAVLAAAQPAVAAERSGEWERLMPMDMLAGGPGWGEAFREAERYARARGGRIAFALVDDKGRVHRHRAARRYGSASVTKAMLLVAYLNRREIRRRPLDGSSRALLRPMITRSDNGAATRALSIVGYGGLNRVARRARMRHFVTGAGWSNTVIAAGDQARFFYRIDRLVPRRHRHYARHLLRNVIPAQRWGIPQGAPRGTRVYLKGGWRPQGAGWLVHQVALVERGDRRVALAVLTDSDQTEAYGHETIRGVARRALRPLERL